MISFYYICIMMQQILQHIRQTLSTCYQASEANAMARLILEKRFGTSLTEIYTGKDKQFLPEQRKDLEDILQRLLRNEPVQYVLGEADFCSEMFSVGPGVLIPRPETEELVAWIGETMPATPCKVLDVGTGSGCIAISLAKRFPQARVTAWDISEQALAIARANNGRLGTNVHFVRRDVLEEAKACEAVGRQSDEGTFDVIVSNPPYVTCSERKEMEANVLDWEPALALFVPDDDPLLFYRSIARLAQRLLKPGGRLFFEINRAYGTVTVNLLQGMNYRNVELRKDLSGNDRMVSAQRI